MSARAIWKGHLSIGDLGCAVALYSAVNGAERTAFHIINRDTGILPGKRAAVALSASSMS